MESLSTSTLTSTLVPARLLVLVASKHSLPATQVTELHVSFPMQTALCLVPLFSIWQKVPVEHVIFVQLVGATHFALDPDTSHWRKSGQFTSSQLAWHVALVRVPRVPRVSSTQTCPSGHSSWSQLVGVTHLTLVLNPFGVVSSTHILPEQQVMSSQLWPMPIAMTVPSSRNNWAQNLMVV